MALKRLRFLTTKYAGRTVEEQALLTPKGANVSPRMHLQGKV